MATSQMSEVIQHLRRTVLVRDGAGLTDGQLLEGFIGRRDEADLAALVRLEGKTRKEAAQQLGCPEGTVAGRLARARAILARRLTQRGVVLSGGAVAVVPSQHAAPACVPPSVVSTTIKAACLVAAGKAASTSVTSAKVAALIEGVLKTMLLTKLKVATARLLLVTVAGAGGLLGYQALATEPAPAPRQPQKPTAHQTAAVNEDVPTVLDKFRAARPDAKDLAIFQLDWTPTLKDAKAKAAREQRPIFLIVVTNSFGDMHSGHC
jgi:hypothetical protein